MSGSLDTSYQVCGDIVRRRPVGLSPWIELLPREHRRDCAAVFALVRTLRDMVEEVGEDGIPVGQAVEGLAFWRQWLVDGCWDDVDDPIAEAVRYSVLANEIPQEWLISLVDALTADLTASRRFAGLNDLVDYCYASTSTAWLAVGHILGGEDSDARARIAEMGVGERLTNVICDVGEDLRAGRVYLPLDHLARHRVSEAHLRAKVITKGYARLTEELAATAEAYFDSSLAGLASWPPGARRAAAVAAAVQRDQLRSVRRNRYDNLTRSAELPAMRRRAIAGRAFVHPTRGKRHVPEGLPDGNVLIGAPQSSAPPGGAPPLAQSA
jgi:phytoene synthase